MTKAYQDERDSYRQYYKAPGKSEQEGNSELKTTPLLSLEVRHAVDYESEQAKASQDQVVQQYGLLGFDLDRSEEPILLNTNAPHSTFICGSQGSGKSYTLSVMLENCLLGDESINKLAQPLAGVVFHYDKDSSLVAEAANLSSRGIEVNVIVPRTSMGTSRIDRYQNLPSAGKPLKIHEFVLQEHHLNVERMHKLMAFNEQDGNVPLYMEVIHQILRDMALTGKSFSYDSFLHRLENQKNFTAQQCGPMNIRLKLLETALKYDRARRSNPQKAKAPRYSPQKPQTDIFELQEGTLTIVDFTDPLIDQASACIFFDMCLALFKECRPVNARKEPAFNLVVALDEAHKFLNTSDAAANFTNSMLTTVREQRHNGASIIVATQEPTISPDLMDLCSTTIVHHFNSPNWFNAIRDHLPGVSKLVAGSQQQEDIFKRILDLNPGESLVFSPSSFFCMEDGKPKKLGSSILNMKTRWRDGKDGGSSKMASGE